MAADNKDTIYVDIDDEITTIIDKVQGSSAKVVALVLPKRATTLQSIVNMKLLKRAADENKKNLVLITTESGLLPLAGAVGLHVAKTPTSRPEIPMAPQPMSNAEEEVDETDALLDDGDAYTAENAGDRPIGELAGGAAATMPLPKHPGAGNGVETIELDNAEAPAAAAAARTNPRPSRAKKDKKLQVPNFDRFRVLLVAGVLLLLILIIGGWWAFAIAPKASIYIKTDASAINTNVDFTLSTTADSLSTSSKIVPAKQAQVQKTLTGNAQATGQQNKGDKATGTVTFSTSCANGTQLIPAGTGVSANGKTYITQKTAMLMGGTPGKGCQFSGSAPIIAQAAGAAYNTDNDVKFTLSKGSMYDASSINAHGSASGGTDNIETVVSQADIDSAKGKINADSSEVQGELKQQLTNQGLFAVATTFNAGQPTVTASASVGDAADSVTVTEVITYTMLGANEDHIKTLIDNNVKSQIDTGTQDILSEGITQGSFKLNDLTASGASMNIQTTAEVGPDINVDQIAQEAAGKKSNEIRSSIQDNPDVTDVTVKMSPFWVTKAPHDVKKITVTVAKPTSND
jgi:hypothetical protein